MAKVVVKSLKGTKSGARSSAVQKNFVDESGRRRRVWTVDAGSGSFGDDLLDVFTKNVRKARRDNKTVVGAADIAPGKR